MELGGFDGTTGWVGEALIGGDAGVVDQNVDCKEAIGGEVIFGGGDDMRDGIGWI